MSEGGPYFDVDPSSGLVYVVSVTSLGGNMATLKVDATDPRGLRTTTSVEVSVEAWLR